MNAKQRTFGIAQPLKEREQRVRNSRHNEPHRIRRRHVIQNKDGTIRIAFEWVPVTEPYKMLVAAGPTGTWGKVNDGGPDAGKKHAKAK